MFVERVQTCQTERRHQHTDDTRAGRPSAEQAVGGPSCRKHPGDPGDLERRDGPAGMADVHMEVLLEHRGPPVEHGETHDVDEEIAHGDDPDRGVKKDFAAQERFVFGFLLGAGLRFWSLGFPGLQFGESHR